jgi:hypothetical protein
MIELPPTLLGYLCQLTMIHAIVSGKMNANILYLSTVSYSNPLLPLAYVFKSC